MDVTYFPYDSQFCDIELASWGFPVDAVNLTFFKTEINLEDYRPNGEWNLVTTSQKPSVITEDELEFSELFFKMEFKRYYGHYLMMVFLTVTLGMASLVIIFTIFIIRLYHQPEHDKAPKWMHSLARKFLKLKCRSERINHLDHLEQSQVTENGQPKDGRICLESRKQFTPYTNKELAEFFDYFLLGVFTVLYILVILCFPIVLSTST
ncbi:unnamed protein product [Mytilus coruscus]|uniref:Neurotransmitter-gated ion-channel ligand-binding domain-containing protein n=1 Tax=Mytilus coruscus TaxID=42192 RepID=A0A6J8C037_MYTCO|nr:unnamed protein product [Mytilus coruscus]